MSYRSELAQAGPRSQVQLQVQGGLHRSSGPANQYCSDTELILPTVSRIALLFLATCVTGLTVRLALLHSPRPDRSDVGEWRQSLVSSNATGFFLGGTASTRYFESHGWKGVCTDPFAREPLEWDFENRTCKLVRQPVGAHHDTKVQIPDCTDQPDVLKRLFRLVQHGAQCPMVERSTIGIVELLSLVAAPSVIDYVSLDVDSLNLEVLQAFPFERSCVRAWQVKHASRDVIMSGIRDVLEPRGCHLKDGDGEFFVRCPCTDVPPRRGKQRSDESVFVAADIRADGTIGKKGMVRRVKQHQASALEALTSFEA